MLLSGTRLNDDINHDGLLKHTGGMSLVLHHFWQKNTLWINENLLKNEVTDQIGFLCSLLGNLWTLHRQKMSLYWYVLDPWTYLDRYCP